MVERSLSTSGTLALAALLLIGVLAPGPCSGPVAEGGAPVDPACEAAPHGTDTLSFVQCLNEVLAEGENVEIADTVQCLPPGCSMTLTMSNESAQPACFLPEGENDPPGPRCALPRVIFTCPGPPQFMPSYLLCPLDDANFGIGSDRVEIGEVVDDAGNMQMADVHVGPGPYHAIDPDSVLSKVDGSTGTKNCNQCHSPAAPIGDLEISEPIDEFDKPGCIIATDEPKQLAQPGTCDGREAEAKTLAEVCECIDTVLVTNDPLHPLNTAQGAIVSALCHELESYRQVRGICGSADCPKGSGPGCEDPGEPCSQVSGATLGEQTGYSCQEIAPDAFECRTDWLCQDYSHTGGGKFLTDGAVSMVRLEVASDVGANDPDSFCDSQSITGSLSVFNYLTRTLIEADSFTTFQADRTGADFSTSGTGTALVDGSPTDIEFEASVQGGTVEFEVREAGETEPLAGGTGEAGRAAFDLTVTP